MHGCFLKPQIIQLLDQIHRHLADIVIHDEGLRDSHDPTGFRKWERIVQEVRMVTERAVHEKWTAVETARELDSRIDRILEKRRWMLAREEGAGL